LVGLTKKLDEITNDVFVAPIEEGGADTSVSGTSCAANAMNIVIDVRRKVIVDDVGNIGNIQATCSNRSSDQDGRPPSAEGLECHLTLALATVTVDRRCRKVMAHQEIAEHISHALGLHEDERETEFRFGLGSEYIEKDAALIGIFNILNLLSDVLGRAADSANREEDIVLQEVFSENLDITGEGSAEHESLTLVNVGHIFALDNATDLGFKTHVQHAISFIQHQVLNIRQTDAPALDEINETTRGGT
jgi:hypothetical protein